MTSAAAIVVSGGPAPGINSVIASVVIECEHHHLPVYGITDGFEGIALRGSSALEDLQVSKISRIHSTGGSILSTSRYNPLLRSNDKDKLLQTFAERSISKLIIIGGEGSLYLSQQIAATYPHLQIIHVPKTIDNDIPLPGGAPTFGYESARQAGAKVIETLLVDAKTTRRWYLVTCMGRSSGCLSLGVGLSGSATLTILPEECSRGSETISNIASRILETVSYREDLGRPYGVVILAEGIVDTLSPSEPLVRSAPRDSIGRIHLSEVNLGEAIAAALKKQHMKPPHPLAVTTKDIGYELRCCPPCPFDIEYTRALGYGAARLALSGGENRIVTFNAGKLDSLPLNALNSPDGKVSPRTVDLGSDLYSVARHHMVLPPPHDAHDN